LCIAGDFTRYDEHAVKQINRNIELLRYRKFGDGLLMVELVHVPKGSRTGAASIAAPIRGVANVSSDSATDPYQSQRITYRVANASVSIRDLFDAVGSYLTSLGDDVQTKELKYYIAFKRIKNFVCLEVYPQAGTVLAYLKLDPSIVPMEPGFTRDVRKIGHFGTGDLEVSMKTPEDFARAQPLFQLAYERG
jgi:predicted transport protein